jgi:GTP-binding protein EngB required for normal cell division
MMMEFLQSTGYEFIVVMTKSDKLKKKKDYNERIENSKKEMSFVPEDRLIPFSSENGQGLDIVKKYIEEYLGE